MSYTGRLKAYWVVLIVCTLQDFSTVLAAISSHPGHVKVKLELQRCWLLVNSRENVHLYIWWEVWTESVSEMRGLTPLLHTVLCKHVCWSIVPVFLLQWEAVGREAIVEHNTYIPAVHCSAVPRARVCSQNAFYWIGTVTCSNYLWLCTCIPDLEFTCNRSSTCV